MPMPKSANPISLAAAQATPCGDEASAPGRTAGKATTGTSLHGHLRKTKICAYFKEGACQYGAACKFAHSEKELQDVPDLIKTRLCEKFMSGGCDDPECVFAHGMEELRSNQMFHKKALCVWNEKGTCRNGSQCRFAHGMAELRAHRASKARASVPAGEAATRSCVQATKATLIVRPPPGFDPLPGHVVLRPSKTPPVASNGDDREDIDKGNLSAKVNDSVSELEAALQAELQTLRQTVCSLTMQCDVLKYQVGAADAFRAAEPPPVPAATHMSLLKAAEPFKPIGPAGWDLGMPSELMGM